MSSKSKGSITLLGIVTRPLVISILLMASVIGIASSAYFVNIGPSSLLIQQQNGSVANATSLTLNLGGVPAAGHTIVLAVLYQNPSNTGNISVSGLGAAWIPGYQTAATGMSIAFVYGQHTSGAGQTITITVPEADNLQATCSDWINLTTIEDAGSQMTANARSISSHVSSTTSNPNAVVFAVTAYLGTALASPPQGNYVPLNTAGSSTMNLVGGYTVTRATNTHTNNFVFSTSSQWLSASVALDSSGANQPLFGATPLTDFTGGQLYLKKFSGYLYNGSNTMPPAHDADGRNIAQQIQPLDVNGHPSATGKIGVVGIGMQNWTLELCTPNTPFNGCLPYTFTDDAAKLAGVNPRTVLVDCAQGGNYASDWENPGSSAWKTCLNRMAARTYKVTPAQVQVVLWKEIDAYPKVSLNKLSGATCPAVPVVGVDPDACVYEAAMASVARTVKSQFPNAQQMFLHSRTYAGFATSHENSEPYAYEYGFSNKWLIQAQISQLAGGGIDPLAGDLSYTAAPWLAWGPYFWASGTTPRSDGQVWVGGDFEADGTHISDCTFYGITCGVKKIANLMINFYSTSPYSTWFMASS
jgi:hypothetical protein